MAWDGQLRHAVIDAGRTAIPAGGCQRTRLDPERVLFLGFWVLGETDSGRPTNLSSEQRGVILGECQKTRPDPERACLREGWESRSWGEGEEGLIAARELTPRTSRHHGLG